MRGTSDCCDCFEEISISYHLAMKRTNGNNLGLGKMIQHDFHCRFSLECKSLRAVEAHIAHIAGNVLTIFGKMNQKDSLVAFLPLHPDPYLMHFRGFQTLDPVDGLISLISP